MQGIPHRGLDGRDHGLSQVLLQRRCDSGSAHACASDVYPIGVCLVHLSHQSVDLVQWGNPNPLQIQGLHTNHLETITFQELRQPDRQLCDIRGCYRESLQAETPERSERGGRRGRSRNARRLFDSLDYLLIAARSPHEAHRSTSHRNAVRFDDGEDFCGLFDIRADGHFCVGLDLVCIQGQRHPREVQTDPSRHEVVILPLHF